MTLYDPTLAPPAGFEDFDASLGAVSPILTARSKIELALSDLENALANDTARDSRLKALLGHMMDCVLETLDDQAPDVARELWESHASVTAWDYADRHGITDIYEEAKA